MSIARAELKYSVHGGTGWVPRTRTLRDERDQIWAACGASSEFGPLRTVLLHRPGPEIEGVHDIAGALWVAALDAGRAREEHDALAALYEAHGVTVQLVEDRSHAYPNLYFTRDSFAMTPEGAILARPASLVRAGEERVIARTLALLGIPIVLSVYGQGTFEGGDLLLVNENLALIGVGRRTNWVGARQVEQLLRGIGFAEVVLVPISETCIHLDCAYSLLSPSVALCHARHRSPHAEEALRRHGFHIVEASDGPENELGLGLNVVALEPGLVIMPARCPETRRLIASAGVDYLEVELDELMKGGGAVHCVTGVLHREG